MRASAIASRYASALVDVVTGASAQTEAQQVVRQLRAFEEALKTSPELRAVLSSPAIATARKRAVIGRLAEAMQLSRIARNFLFVLIDNRRVAALAEILEAFEILLDERLGYSRVDVTSAAELSEPRRQALAAEFGRLTGKRVRPRFSVDPALIGGVIARVGSTVYDGSVRGRLQTLGRRLTAQ